jgi:hypothetical protein
MTLQILRTTVFVVAFQVTHLATAAEFFEIDDVVGGPGLRHRELERLSGDGSTIVGWNYRDFNPGFFRWQRDTGAVELGVEGTGFAGVVHDGSAILIAKYADEFLPDARQRIIEWTENGLQDLGVVDDQYTFGLQDTGNYILGSKGSSPQEWILWSKTNGLEVTNGTGWGRDASAAGKVVGTLNGKAFVWTKETGQLPLITEPHASSTAGGISSDGTVIAGDLRIQDTGSSTLFRWTQEEGLQPLGEGTFSRLSNDGSTIFGKNGEQPFRWTQETGFDFISLPPGNEDVASIGWIDVTHDGAMAAVGVTFTSGEGHPFVWREGRGMTSVEDMLANEFGLADRIAGWQFPRNHLEVSEDGKILAGTSLNPDGFLDLWVADLHSAPGDFNNDGTVDAADYVVWRNGLGTSYTQPDYDVWRDHFGQTLGASSLRATVPEPVSLALAFVCYFALGLAASRCSTLHSD